MLNYNVIQLFLISIGGVLLLVAYGLMVHRVWKRKEAVKEQHKFVCLESNFQQAFPQSFKRERRAALRKARRDIKNERKAHRNGA